jgi:hypothetical protein
VPRRRQRPGLAEAEIAEGILRGVDASHDHHVRRVGFELAHRQVDGGERRSAGGIDHVVDSAEVEAVRDPARCHVQQQPRERILRPFGQKPVRAIDDRGSRTAEHERKARPQEVPRAEIARAAARPQDHRRARPVVGAIGVARVLDRLPRRLEREELHGVDRRKRVRRNSELHGIEALVVQKTAPLRVDLVLGLPVGVEVELPVPPVLGTLGDGVDFGEDVVIGERSGALGIGSCRRWRRLEFLGLGRQNDYSAKP